MGHVVVISFIFIGVAADFMSVIDDAWQSGPATGGTFWASAELNSGDQPARGLGVVKPEVHFDRKGSGNV